MPTSLVVAIFFAGDAIMAAATLGSFGLAAASFAMSYVISSLVTRAFSPGQSAGQQAVDNGVRQQNPPATSNNIPVVYGDAYLGGTFVDAVLSTDQNVMYYVLAVSSIVQSSSTFGFDVTKMYYGDRTITFDATDTTKVASLTDGAGNVDTKVAGNLFIYLYTSDYSGTITAYNGSSLPSAVMGGADIAAAQRWPSSGRQMNGLAFAIVKLTYNRDADTTSMMPITFKVSQYLNGAGAAYPGAVWLDYTKSTVYGAGMATDLVDAASATALDSYSQATITFTNSSGLPDSQPRYKINGVIDTGQTALSNVEKIMMACDSWNQYNEASGKWSVVINRDTASTFSFDDTNIIGEIKTSLLDISNSINQIEAQFPSKLNRDQTDIVYLQTPSGLLYANEPVNKYSCAFELVNDSVQVAYLANRTLEQAREDLIVTISAAYPAIQVDAGDVVSLTNAAYGWTNKLFRVMKVSEISLPDGNLGAALDLTEYNAAVYDNADITQYSAAPNSNLSSANFFSSVAAPVVSNSYPANDIPSFDVRVTTPTIGRVTTLELYYSLVPTPTASQWTRFDTYTAPSSTTLLGGNDFTFRNEMLPANTYYFGFVAKNDIGQSTISGASSAFVWAPTGTTGTQTAIVYLYQWLAAAPGDPSGTSTYTWATATNSAYTGGNGWQVTIPANPGTAGISLWQAAISISAPATDVTTTVSWTTGFSKTAISTNGTNGVNAVRAYALYTGNPTVTGAAVTKTGTALPATTDFSPTSATAFTTDTQTPASGQAMFQSDGLYYPVTNQTIWNTPYLSNLKVGNLSAISADLGTITAGDLSIGSTPALSGTTMTGTGSHLYANGNFAMGNPTQNFVYNGSNVYLNGFTVANNSAYQSSTVTNTPVTFFTFSITRAGNVIVFMNGYFKAQTTLAVLGGSAYVLLFVELRNSANVVLQYTYIEFLGQVSRFGTGVYAIKSAMSSVMVATLPVDTYTVTIKGYAAYDNSAGTGVGTNQPVTVEGFLSTYQATIG